MHARKYALELLESYPALSIPRNFINLFEKTKLARRNDISFNEIDKLRVNYFGSCEGKLRWEF